VPLLEEGTWTVQDAITSVLLVSARGLCTGFALQFLQHRYHYLYHHTLALIATVSQRPLLNLLQLGQVPFTSLSSPRLCAPAGRAIASRYITESFNLRILRPQNHTNGGHHERQERADLGRRHLVLYHLMGCRGPKDMGESRHDKVVWRG